MEIKIFESADQSARYVAGEVASQIISNPKSTLGVATGRTMDAVYHHLANIYKQEKFDCSNAKAFALDEYVGLKVDDENSYRSYLDFHLFSPLGFNKKNTFIPETHSSKLDEAGFEYEKLIKESGSVELQLLGIGLNGHIGLNEPGSALDSRTRLVALSNKTRESNKALFPKGIEVPLTAMTMGIGTILDSKRILLLATGSTKAEIIQKLVNGDVNSKIPASAIKMHPNAELVLDREAASLIS